MGGVDSGHETPSGCVEMITKCGIGTQKFFGTLETVDNSGMVPSTEPLSNLDELQAK